MEKKITPSLEDYLEAIYNISESGQPVRVTDIAVVLGIAKPSVHIAMHNLKDAAYIEQEYYGNIQLTPEGQKVARKIQQRHSIILKFLTDVLDVPHELAGQEACKIEHVIGEITTSRMEEYTKKIVEVRGHNHK